MSLSDVTELLSLLSKRASRDAHLSVADSLVSSVASKTGLSCNVKGFLDTACRAMCELEAHGKPNVVYFLCRCIADKKEDGKTPILPLDRMHFGLIQYQLEFFNATHVCQVEALKELKTANPDGRFWIKPDRTDVKPALLESMRKEWNGDVDLGNGKFQSLRREYEERSAAFTEAPKANNCHNLQ